MMMTIMIVLRKQLAHITRGRAGGPAAARCLPFGKDSINPEKNQISGEAEEAGRAGRVPISLSYLLPTTSPPFVTDGLKSNDGFLPSLSLRSGGSFFRILLLLPFKFLLGSLPTALTIRDCFFSSSASSFGEIGV